MTCQGSWCWSENAPTSTRFAFQTHLQQFAVSASHQVNQRLSLCQAHVLAAASPGGELLLDSILRRQLHPAELTPGNNL